MKHKKQINPNAPKSFNPYIVAVNNGYEVIVNRRDCMEYSDQDRYVFTSKRALCNWILTRIADMYVPQPHNPSSRK